MGQFALTVAWHVTDHKHVGIAWKRVNGRKENNKTGEKRLKHPLPKKAALDIAKIEAVCAALNQFESSKVTLRIPDPELCNLINDGKFKPFLEKVRHQDVGSKASKSLSESYHKLFDAVSRHHSVRAEAINDNDPIFENLTQAAERVSTEKKPKKPKGEKGGSKSIRGQHHVSRVPDAGL